jgi:hypothetical protein
MINDLPLHVALIMAAWIGFCFGNIFQILIQAWGHK